VETVRKVKTNNNRKINSQDKLFRMSEEELIEYFEHVIARRFYR
jgi:hypothetical protein